MDYKLYCGDCLDILSTLKAGSVDAIITSPPYNVGKEYEHGTSVLDYEYMLRRFIANAAQIVDSGGFIAINTNDRLVSTEIRTGINPVFPIIDNECVRRGLVLYDRRIWVKDPAWMTNQWHSSTIKSVDEFEYVFIYQKPGASKRLLKITRYIANARDNAGITNSDIDNHFGYNGMAGHWTSQKSQPEAPSIEQWQKLKALLGVNGDIDTDIAKENERIRLRLSPQEWSDWGSRSVWKISSVRKNDVHPATFPVELPRRLIRLLTEQAATILDPFMGSGTTGFAALQEGRRFIGVELNPQYFAIAEKRIAHAQPPLLLADAPAAPRKWGEMEV